MAIKGLKEILEKFKKEEIKDEDSFETELNKLLPLEWIPKAKFNEKSDEAKNLKDQLDAQTKLVNELKEKGNLSDEYKNQIEKLKSDMAAKDEEYKSSIVKMRKDAAIDSALTKSKAKAVKAVRAYLDEGKIVVNEDGSVLGLDEQLKKIKEDTPFLFETDDPAKPDPHKPVFRGGDPAPGKGDDLRAAMMEAAGLKIGK